jgi:outer membrane protein assembly factor BamE
VKLTHRTIWLNLTTALLLCVLSACVYQVDVQQGNKLEPQDVEAIKVGMTRNQVRFLLGTPVVSDLFRNDRWDYVYFFRKGKSKTPDRRWLIVWFDGDLVREVERDVQVQPG